MDWDISQNCYTGSLIQGHWSKFKVTIHIMVKNWQIVVRAMTPNPLYKFEYFTGLLPWTEGSVMTLIQGYWSKVKVTMLIMI